MSLPENENQQGNSVSAQARVEAAKVRELAAQPASEAVEKATEEKTERTKAATKSEAAKPEAVPSSMQQPVVIKQGGGKGMALGALVLAILALGATGFMVVEGRNQLARQQLAFDQKISDAAVGASKNATLLADTEQHQQSIDNQLNQLQAQVRMQGDGLAKANEAMNQLLRSRTDWVVDETEAGLNLAAQQLLIAGDVPSAVAVLEGIDARLARFDQPQLLLIKQAISHDLGQLKQRPFLDTSSAALRLNRLEAAVGGLPLVMDDSLTAPEVSKVPADTTSGSWWQNSWNQVVNSVKGMVEVRHLENSDAMLMSPEQIFYVRENLRLRLLSARVALLQRQGDIYRNDLNTAENAVKQYFDVNSPVVKSWLQEMDALKGLDLGGSDASALAQSLKAVADYQQSRNGDDLTAGLPNISASNANAASAPAANSATSEASAPATVPAEATRANNAPASEPKVSGSPEAAQAAPKANEAASAPKTTAPTVPAASATKGVVS